MTGTTGVEETTGTTELGVTVEVTGQIVVEIGIMLVTTIVEDAGPLLPKLADASSNEGVKGVHTVGNLWRTRSDGDLLRAVSGRGGVRNDWDYRCRTDHWRDCGRSSWVLGCENDRGLIGRCQRGNRGVGVRGSDAARSHHGRRGASGRVNGRHIRDGSWVGWRSSLNRGDSG